MQTAVAYAGAALDTLRLVNGVRLFQYAGDGIHGAVLCTEVAAYAVLGVDGIVEHRHALLGAAFLFHDMLHIFVTEIGKSGKNRVR